MIKRFLLIIALICILALSIIGWLAWKYIYKSNVEIDNKQRSFYLYTGDNFDSLLFRLNKQQILVDLESFVWVAKKMNLPNHVYAGRYLVHEGLNNRELVNLLRSGIQTPVKITFHNVRTKKELAGELAMQIELDSLAIAQPLHNEAYAKKFGFTKENFACMFIPNTYEVYWNISTDGLFERFSREYKKFWTDARLKKAEKIGLTPVEVSILASIIEKESSYIDEFPVIAGVYLNRINRRMPLQADPTIVFAIGDFSIKRVLHKHLEIKSPYNTYKNRGLPPGPICLPSIQAINSVLNKKSHNYLYFCAKDDFSGKHVFSKTLRQHNQNARRYRNALNKRRIYN